MCESLDVSYILYQVKQKWHCSRDKIEVANIMFFHHL